MLADEGFNISTFYFIDFFNGKNGLVNRHFFLHQAKETFRLPKMVRQIPSAGLLGALSHFTLGARLRLELDQHVFSSSGFKRKCGSALAVSLTACKNSQQDRNHEKQPGPFPRDRCQNESTIYLNCQQCFLILGFCGCWIHKRWRFAPGRPVLRCVLG